MIDVVGLGEVMVALQPEGSAPLEEASRLVPRIAGAEMNVCAAVARLGLSAALCTRLGDDPWGRRVLLRMEGLGIDCSLVEVDADAPTGVFFKELLAGDERRVYYYRRGSAASRLSAADGLRCAGLRPRALMVSGITLALGRGPVEAALAACREIKARGGWVVIDPNLRPQLGGLPAVDRPLRELLSSCDLMLAGLAEAAELFGTDDPPEILRHARYAGVRELVLKDGARGCWYQDGSEMRRMLPEPTEVVDPIGAGDAFDGGYLTGRLSGASRQAAARLGSKLGARVAATSGDVEGLPTPEEVSQLKRP